MDFRKFLLENVSDGKYKVEIDEEEAIKLIKTYCSKVDIEAPFWRGMSKQSNNFYIFEAENGNRVSASMSDSGNYYNAIIDHVIKDENKSYPLRGKSIICGNNANFKHALSFGRQMFAIFPYDDTTIGYLPTFDIWHCNVKFDEKSIDLLSFNEMLHYFKIDSLQYDLIISGIKEVVKNDNEKDELYKLYRDRLISLVGTDISKIEHNIIKSFKSLGHFFDKYKNDEIPRELWIGGKCIAIEFRTYLKIKDKLK